MNDDVGQGPPLRLERPVAAEAGVGVNDEMMAVPERRAPLHTNVGEEASSAPAEGTNLPQINDLLERDVRVVVAAPLATVS